MADAFTIEGYEKMVKKPTFEQLAADNLPSAQSMVNQQMKDVEVSVIAEFRAKYGDKPFTCRWVQKSKDNPYLMTFEVAIMQEREETHE